MRTKRKYHKTHLTRPRKAAGARRRRNLEHRKRLVALGMEESKVEKMNASDVRALLKYPVKTKQQIEAAKAAQD